MRPTDKTLAELTAADLMTRDVAVVPRCLSMRSTARLLSDMHVSGAPVVDELGACIGVISSTDFMEWTASGPRAQTECGCICADWQLFDDQAIPTDEVCTRMTSDPVTVEPSVPIAKLAKMMLDTHIHRIVVVDERNHPVGIVSSTDILAAVAAEFQPCSHQ